MYKLYDINKLIKRKQKLDRGIKELNKAIGMPLYHSRIDMRRGKIITENIFAGFFSKVGVAYKRICRK